MPHLPMSPFTELGHARPHTCVHSYNTACPQIATYVAIAVGVILLCSKQIMNAGSIQLS